MQALKDSALTFAELFTRQLYWRMPFLWGAYRTLKRLQTRPGKLYLKGSVLEARLREILSTKPPLVMLHSSIDGIVMASDSEPHSPLDPLGASMSLLAILDRLLGSQGTLVMPTHPRYSEDPGFMRDKSRLILEYDPKNTPSSVGLLTELFRRRPGTLRSLHPLSSLAARGPLAESLLADNLNLDRPLPHGIHSGYLRFCQNGGTVISIGLPLIECISILHTAEEVRNQDWPIKDFFYERRFRVIGTNGETWTVRERRPQFVRSLALAKVRRDWLQEGILHESHIQGTRLDWANSRQVFEFMMQRNQDGYPYYFSRLARL